ncbi:hypothetical protein MKX03_011346 [Papaver bracteatum]|nr:hypothetical protein MKX03_011346 [Papaver bracteatum]
MPIEQLGKDARREIREQTIEKSMHFKKYQNDWGTHADKIDKKMREFEELESEISGMKNDLVLRCRHSSTYYKTWHDVEDGFHKLEKVFFQLLPDGGEMDLAKKWSAVKLGVEELVGK